MILSLIHPLGRSGRQTIGFFPPLNEKKSEKKLIENFRENNNFPLQEEVKMHKLFFAVYSKTDENPTSEMVDEPKM